MLKILNVFSSEAANAFLHTSDPVALQTGELAATVGAGFLCSAGSSFALVSAAAGFLGCVACGLASFAVAVAVFSFC